MRHKGDILIVDDETIVLQGARKILTAEGLKVDVVSGADAAVARMREEGYRLVLSDLLLPGMDGIDLMLALRRRHYRTPVVIVTGFATLDRAIDSFRNGAFDFLPKPFDAAELIGVVRRALGYADRVGPGSPSEQRPGAPPPDEIYGLGQHSEVELQAGGCATVRLGCTFADLGSDLVSLALPDPLDEVRQGLECARITGRDESIHRVWAPMTGRVIEPIRMPDPDRRRLDGTPLFRMQATELERELRNLTHHRPRPAQGKTFPKEPSW